MTGDDAVGGSGELTLRLLLDENVDRAVAAELRNAGHDVELVVDVDRLGPGAEDATDIAPYALETDRMVVTKDTDFLSMVSDEHAGVLFLNDHHATARDVAEAIGSAVASYPSRDYFAGTELVDRWL